MYTRKGYEIAPPVVAGVLETFAERCIDPKFRSRYTLRGFNSGVSRHPDKLLLPLGTEGFKEFNLGLGFNHEFFYGLLNGAALAVTEPELELRPRFSVNSFLGNNLREGENLEGVMRSYGILGRDDYRWHFDLYYRTWQTRSHYRDLPGKDILELTISDNGDDSLPTDDNFRELCRRMFWDVLGEQAVQRLPRKSLEGTE
jgi:hypothetical protein